MLRRELSFAPSGLGVCHGSDTTACAVGCILSPLGGFSPCGFIGKTGTGFFRKTQIGFSENSDRLFLKPFGAMDRFKAAWSGFIFLSRFCILEG